MSDFTHQSFRVSKWKRDEEYLKTVSELQDMGAAFFVTDVPTCQPCVETPKHKKLPVGWITLIWKLETENKNGEIIVEYEAEDRFQFNPNSYNMDSFKEEISISYERFAEGYDLNNVDFVIPGGIPPMDNDIIDPLCSDIKVLLKEQGY